MIEPMAGALVRFACPKCDYDVAQTLGDGLDRCPECGVPIAEATCEAVPRSIRRRLGVAVFLPGFGAVAGGVAGAIACVAMDIDAWWLIVGVGAALAGGGFWILYRTDMRAQVRRNPEGARLRAVEVLIAAAIVNGFLFVAAWCAVALASFALPFY